MYQISMPFLSSLDNLLFDAYITFFSKSVDKFKIKQKTCFFKVMNAVPFQ